MPQDNQDPDELWSLRNQYYVGAYDAVFIEATSARIEPGDTAALAERDYFVQLALLGKGKPIELTENSVGPEFKALAHLSALMHEDGGEEAELSALKTLVDQNAGNARVRFIAGTAFAKFGEDPNEALRILHCATNSLEALHLSCAILLSLDRIDLAQKKLELMQETDEDSTLTQLSATWIHIATATESSLREAMYALEELIGKWQATPLLIGALSCVLIHQGKYSETEKLISSCPEHHTPELFINQIVAAQHEGRRLDEYIGGLKQVDPAHPWFQEMSSQSAIFDQAAEGFKL